MSPHRLSKASHWLKRFHLKTLDYYANLQLTYQNNRILLFAKTSGFDLNRIQNLPRVNATLVINRFLPALQPHSD